MSIDYLSCSHCGDGFPDVIDYISCDCGRTWCCLECAEEDGFMEMPEIGSTDEEYLATSCKYCREEDFDDWLNECCYQCKYMSEICMYGEE